MRTGATITAAAGLALSAAACGGSGGGQVAQPGTTGSLSPSSQVLAFSRCMRSHGVATFPDPDSGGVLPKVQVADLASSSPRFAPAHRACVRLLPNAGQPSSAQVRQAWTEMRGFAACMRFHGVPGWPDPTATSRQDPRPFFYTPPSIDPTAPQITAKINACRHVLRGDNPLVTTQ